MRQDQLQSEPRARPEQWAEQTRGRVLPRSGQAGVRSHVRAEGGGGNVGRGVFEAAGPAVPSKVDDVVEPSRRDVSVAPALVRDGSAVEPPPAMGVARAESITEAEVVGAAVEGALIEVDRAPPGCGDAASCGSAACPVRSIGGPARAPPPPKVCGGERCAGVSSRAAYGSPEEGERRGAFRGASPCLPKALSSITVAGLEASPSARADGSATGDAAESP